MRIRFVLIAVLFLSLSGFIKAAFACESCTIARLGRDNQGIKTESQDHQWFFYYLLEQQNWHKLDPREAHTLHHQDHHVHDKTTEDFHHLTLGKPLNSRLTLFGEIPYVVKNSLEVDNHSIIGTEQRSEGIGDLTLTGEYTIVDRPSGAFSAIAGMKLPTGNTQQENSAGDRFEPELQPGSGSYDYLLGGAYRHQGRLGWSGNLVYVIKTKGSQNFEYGDLVSSSFLADYILNPRQRYLVRVGIDVNLQYEQKEESDGVKIGDSGGMTLLLGPTFTIETGRNVVWSGTFLLPVVQDLGGVHQELDYIWTAGAKIMWN